MFLFGPPDIEKLKARHDVNGLIKALGYKKDSGDVCSGAAEALVEIGAPAVESLIAALKDKDGNVRRGAAEALVEIGAPAVEPLIAALKDEDEDVRWGAAKVLGKLGDPRAVAPLIATLEDEDAVVRGSAAEALGKIGDPRAVEPLIAAIKDRGENKDVRESAVAALVKIGASAVAPLIAALKDEDGDVRWRAAEALDKLGWKAGQDENGAWYWMAKREWEKCAALGASAAEPLIAAIKDGSGDVRWRAAEALGQIGAPRAVEVLPALSMANIRLLLRAAMPLPQLTSGQAIALIAEHLVNRTRSRASRLKRQKFVLEPTANAPP